MFSDNKYEVFDNESKIRIINPIKTEIETTFLLDTELLFTRQPINTKRVVITTITDASNREKNARSTVKIYEANWNLLINFCSRGVLRKL